MQPIRMRNQDTERERPYPKPQRTHDSKTPAGALTLCRPHNRTGKSFILFPLAQGSKIYPAEGQRVNIWALWLCGLCYN